MARLEQLVTNVIKAVPAGWSVDVQLVNPDIPTRPGPQPTLVIQSLEPLPVEHFYPGMEARIADELPKISQERVRLSFVS